MVPQNILGLAVHLNYFGSFQFPGNFARRTGEMYSSCYTMWSFFIEIINGNIPIKLGRFNLANIRNINYTALHVWEVTTFERVISSGAHQKVKSISLKSELFKQTFETLLKMAPRSSMYHGHTNFKFEPELFHYWNEKMPGNHRIIEHLEVEGSWVSHQNNPSDSKKALNNTDTVGHTGKLHAVTWIASSGDCRSYYFRLGFSPFLFGLFATDPYRSLYRVSVPED